MTTKRVGLIGFGAIGQTVLRGWATHPVRDHTVAAVLTRAHQLDAARLHVGDGIHVTASLDDFLARRLDVAVELAGQQALAEVGPRVLRAGVDLMALSVGCLARPDVHEALRGAAAAGNARILVPVGAIAGLDGLLALRRAGLRKVVYSSTKPPKSWKGTPAETRVDLDALQSPAVVFEGTAREAATAFPKNANLAAAVALAGIGFDATRVVLVADPRSDENQGRIDAEGTDSRLTVTVAGRSEPSNPKSSRITGLSVLAALDNASAAVAFA
jgi:aspartate dehydrogenase